MLEQHWLDCVCGLSWVGGTSLPTRPGIPLAWREAFRGWVLAQVPGGYFEGVAGLVRAVDLPGAWATLVGLRLWVELGGGNQFASMSRDAVWMGAQGPLCCEPPA